MMKYLELAYKNGTIKEFFLSEAENRVKEVYSERAQNEIAQNMLVDTDRAVKFLSKVNEVKAALKAEIEERLGVSVDVGFEPDADTFGIVQNVNALLGISSQKETQAAEQFRRAMQMFAAGLGDDAAMEVATIYEPWVPGRAYAEGEIVKHGTNGVGDAQLYKVVSAHISQSDWTPGATASLYTAIGLNKKGYPVWSRPSGAHDAYSVGDIVDYDGTLYECLIDGNVYSPDEYAAGWKVFKG